MSFAHPLAPAGPREIARVTHGVSVSFNGSEQSGRSAVSSLLSATCCAQNSLSFVTNCERRVRIVSSSVTVVPPPGVEPSWPSRCSRTAGAAATVKLAHVSPTAKRCQCPGTVGVPVTQTNLPSAEHCPDAIVPGAGAAVAATANLNASGEMVAKIKGVCPSGPNCPGRKSNAAAPITLRKSRRVTFDPFFDRDRVRDR